MRPIPNDQPPRTDHFLIDTTLALDTRKLRKDPKETSEE